MMCQNIQQSGGGCSGDAAMMQQQMQQQMHVKMETVDDQNATTAFVLGSQESSAPCDPDGSASYCTYTEAGEACPSPTVDHNLELADTAGSTILLYPVSTERFFPASASEKTFSHSSDFCSKAVMYLIEGVGRRWGLYETRERSQLFQSVQDEMAAKGYVLPVEKIRRKWNNLIVTYKRVKDRSRETGHAKTSWEFFDLMDATLSDTVGIQVMHSSKSKKTSKAVSAPAGSVPPSKIAGALKPHGASELGPAPDDVPPPYHDFTRPLSPPAEISGDRNTVPVTTSVSLETTTTTTAPPELKPGLILLNGDVTTASAAALSLCPTSLVSSAYATGTLPPPAASRSFELTNNNNNNNNSHPPRVRIRSSARLKAPPLRSAAGVRRRGRGGQEAPPPQRNHHNIHALSSSSSSPSTFSSQQSPFPTSSSSSFDASSRTDVGQPQTDSTSSSSSLLEEVLRRQEEQAYLEQAAGRRADARERRRERREVRMAESLGRMATALELLSSKQDTVIALLQRLAERK